MNLEKMDKSIKIILKKGQKAPMPKKLKPMLTTLVSKPFDDQDWIFEIKLDGYRAVASMEGGKVEIESRNNKSFNNKYPTIAAALKTWKVNAVVDGEIISLNEKGISDFQQLQAWQNAGKGDLVYYVFDLLWLDGISTMNIPLLERKEILRNILPPEGIIRFSDHIVENGKQFYELGLEQGLEGIIAKKADSMYHPGIRSQQWLKIKTHQTQDAVIAGFTEGRAGRKHFGALILGIYEDDSLIYVGHTGSGLNEKSLISLYKKMQPLVTNTCPFKKKPKTNMKPTWVQPQLVCEVKFQEWTKDNILRIPIFLRMRDEKKANEVRKE